MGKTTKLSRQRPNKKPLKELFWRELSCINAIKNRTTKNRVEEDLSKFPIKKRKKILKRQSKCYVFVKQVCFSYGESPRTPPLEGTSLHRRNISVERPWGILSLFTACLPLWVKSSRQSRCHVSPTQELTACILRRQCSPARKNRTRKKKSTIEDERKIRDKKKRKMSHQNSWNQPIP